MDGIIECSIDTAAGRDFPNTLREVVRQDPDVIVVGEIRDRTTAAIAIEAALTGHKVFATFHTEDSIGSLVQLIDMNIEAFLISTTVVSSVAQRLAHRDLVRTARRRQPRPNTRCGCFDAESGGRGALHVLSRHWLRDVQWHGVQRPRPASTKCCSTAPSARWCFQSGRRMRIRHHALATLGLCTLQEDGIAKALLGHTTLEEVIWHVPRSTEQRPLDQIAAIANNTA